MTTNCLVPPEIRKTGSIQPGWLVFRCKHIADRKMEKRKTSLRSSNMPKCAPPEEIEKGEITGGFAHNTVFGLADKVVDAVKTGAIKKFFVMAGCDGRMKSREYYTEFAERLPGDTVILTRLCKI